MHTSAFSATSAADLEAQLAALPTAPTLAIAFANVGLDLAAIQGVFRGRGVRACGCSAHGEISDGALDTGTVSGLFVEVDPGAFFVWTGLGGSSAAQAETLGREAVARFDDPQVLLFSGGLTEDGEAVVRALRAGAGREIVAFGGMAGDRLSMERTFSFSESDVLDPGIAAVVFDGARVRLGGGAMSGWEPLGGEQVVTRAEGNVAHEINGEPALDFFERFVGGADNGATAREDGTVPAISIQIPIQVQRPEGALLRAPLLAHANGTSIVFAGGIETGDRFRFSIAPGFEVIEETVAHFAQQRLAGPTPAGVIVVSCVARNMAFGPLLEDELEQLASVYGVPMTGYLSFGEIGALDATNMAALHNDTCCVVTLNPV